MTIAPITSSSLSIGTASMNARRQFGRSGSDLLCRVVVDVDHLICLDGSIEGGAFCRQKPATPLQKIG